MKRKAKIGITSMLEDCYSVKSDYVRSVEESGGVPVVLPALSNIEDIPQQCEGLSGILLIGGPDLDAKTYGQENVPEMKLLPEVVGQYYLSLARYVCEQTNFALLGICLGAQAINVSLGGTLIRHLPAERPEAMEHRRLWPPAENMHLAQFASDSLLPTIFGCDSLLVNSSHHQAINIIAPGWKAVAHASDGIVEAIAPQFSNGRFLLGIQWHPERLFKQEPHCRIFQAFVDAAERVQA
ncbi:MAG: gamma-glutamyl-gamma-aminobutyrate hydrolase family protein [Victivallales bacterium]|nr:gamma-glutamyl-gamma-aminobutyrate hydrolase family protein [Victivallales bacterium]